MNLFFSILVGLREIGAHKFRSALTMLGIILGVCSLVGMFALVAGMTTGMTAALNQIGGLEKIAVIPQEPPVGQEHLADLSPGLTRADADAITALCPLIEKAAPVTEIGFARINQGNVTHRPRRLHGITPAFFDVENHIVELGRAIHDLDVERSSRVCVIGATVRDRLFPVPRGQTPRDPVGEQVEINGQLFTVVGVLQFYETEQARKQREAGREDAIQQRMQQLRSSRQRSVHGTNWLSWKNDVILMPISTMQNVLRSGAVDSQPDLRLSQISVRVRDVTRLNEAIEQVRNVLMTTHRGIEDFGFNTQEFWSDRINEETRNAMRTGGLIASISLIVGGIGIMNIMLASISERIREIGIRKAVGARHRDIFLQILAESCVLSVVGGLVGLVCALGLVQVLGWLAPFEYTPIVRSEAMMVGFLFSASVGAIAGVYPALKAARLDPIAALRYE